VTTEVVLDTQVLTLYICTQKSCVCFKHSLESGSRKILFFL